MNQSVSVQEARLCKTTESFGDRPFTTTQLCFAAENSISPRTARSFLEMWVRDGFVEALPTHPPMYRVRGFGGEKGEILRQAREWFGIE